MDSEVGWIIIVASREKKNSHGFGSEEGEKYVITRTRDGYDDGYSLLLFGISTDALIFPTKHRAREFYKKWNPRPWYVDPKSVSFRKVKRKYRKEWVGYELDSGQSIEEI